MKCTCARCGKEFEAVHKTSVCTDCKIQKCIICDEEFELKWPYTAVTCSSKCRGIYRKESGIGKKVAKKASETLKMKHGVSNASKIALKPRKCAYCGKEFIPSSNRQKYCKDNHYGPCPVCGKLVLIKDMSIGPQACSEQCRQESIRRTCLERYGCETAVISDHARQLSKQTCMRKYGVDHYSKTDEYHEKFKKTSIERFGVDVPMKNSEVQQKAKDTNNERYGGNSPMCSEEVKAKAAETAKEHFGGLGFSSPEILERAKATNIIRYGVPYPAQSDVVKSKMENTCIERYGSKNWLCTRDRLESVIHDSSKIDEYISFSADPKSYILSHYNHTPTCIQLCRDIGITDTTVYSILIKNNCRDMATFRESSMEVELYDFLRSLVPNATIQRCCRSVITPLELDFYLPEYRFGIECNPTITHNSSFSDPWGENPKPMSYHKRKTDICESKGIFLFHIFGYEWVHKKDIVKSMIRHILMKDCVKIYARNCDVRDVSDLDSRNFLNSNHRQGYASSTIRLGLYYDNVLVSLMTFGKSRNTLGSIKDNDTTYELIRYCNQRGTCVIGAASRLFKHALMRFPEICKILSFSDRAHTRGALYETLGFHKVSQSDPSYVWVNTYDESYLSRVACQKKNLRKLFNDDSIDIDNHTERQIMESHGYARVYDSGVIRWEYTKKP